MKYFAPALAIALAALPPFAAAGWTRVAGNNTVVCYADPASIERKGESAKMKNLLNFTLPQTERSLGNKPYLSQREEREYDCRRERYRLLHFSLRADPMFSGALVRSSSDDGEWKPVAPGSLGAALWRTACRKK
jgi:hypothetical protein